MKSVVTYIIIYLVMLLFKPVSDKWPKSGKKQKSVNKQRPFCLTMPHLTALGCKLLSDESYK